MKKEAWDTFVWMGSLIAMANFLSKLGFIPWLADFKLQEFHGCHPTCFISSIIFSIFIELMWFVDTLCRGSSPNFLWCRKQVQDGS
ncbi:anion permease [Sporomusa acidovorans]|uniref:Uncharacterized protein n=1 Tax=Sporomusa acidovorans (strain ATCC 49682 / DSM 3132 / Mol) TaxID=1123286 RepID=A0ABZ3J242_SPOA4|nr:anion permease [Sporomusa acidovorans]OZC13654.1 sodium:sulfate symporter transmembrane region [Sporomusa acidovorans DSM 3132]SDE85998.1 Sodium:sulfate symporter transmembrane region [Sporomusa acidovorans]